MEMCNLRRISIGRAEFLDENLMKKLEENSPLLEDLRLVDCPKLTHLEISSLFKSKRWRSNADFYESKQLKLITYSTKNMQVFEDPGESEIFTSPREANEFLLGNYDCKMEVTA
ncbi:hypothetical protein OROHE_022609 [Orobanche hederae]